jgi:hypothetical protein
MTYYGLITAGRESHKKAGITEGRSRLVVENWVETSTGVIGFRVHG